MKGKLIATRGLPASGKTTWAKAQVAAVPPGRVVRVNRDDLRLMLHGEPHHIGVTEQQITAAQHNAIRALLADGVTVIVDDTNLRARNLRALAELAARAGAEFEVCEFTDVPLQVCRERNAAREQGRVPDEVIVTMHQKFLAGRTLPLPVPQLSALSTVDAPSTAYIPDPALPKAIMVDIDGTVALHNGRSPYDLARVHEDAPNLPVINAVRAMHAAGYTIVFCSGREDLCRAATEKWLREHVAVPFAALHMRATGDKRGDDVVKLEMFDEHIRDAYQVDFVLDDRNRVVDAWRSIGLAVFQVAEGDF